MNTRTIAEEKLPDGRFLVGKFFYTKGGHNWFHGGETPRGYYLSLHIEEREASGSYTIVKTTLGRGFKRLVEGATRFSAKRLAALVVDPELFGKLREATLTQDWAGAQR